jgi:hypothetical protein
MEEHQNRVNRAKTGELTKLATCGQLGSQDEKKPQTLQFFAKARRKLTAFRDEVCEGRDAVPVLSHSSESTTQ